MDVIKKYKGEPGAPMLEFPKSMDDQQRYDQGYYYGKKYGKTDFEQKARLAGAIKGRKEYVLIQLLKGKTYD